MAFRLNPYLNVNTYSDTAPLDGFSKGNSIEVPSPGNPYSPEKADLPAQGFPTKLDVDYGTVDDVLPSHMQYLANYLGMGGKKQNGITQFLQRALNNGETVDDIRQADDATMSMSFADRLAQKTAALDNTQFEQIKAQIQGELSNRPQIPTMPEVENPSVPASIFALAAGLLSPNQYRNDVFAAPFNYELKERDQKYQQSLQQFQMDWDVHQSKLKNLDTLLGYQQQRDIALANLENDALNRGQNEQNQLLMIARGLEADLDKVKSSQAGALFQRLRDIYNAAGFPEMAPSKETEEGIVQALRDQEEMMAQAKTLEGRRKLIPSLINSINRDGVSAARGLSGTLLKGIMATDPEGLVAWGVDPLDLDRRIKALEAPTPRELFNKQRIETEKSRAQKYQSDIGLNKAKAENLARQTWWMDEINGTKIAKGKAEIENLYALIKDRGDKNAIAVMKANKMAMAQSQTSINVGMSTLSAQINEISRQINLKQTELNKIGTGTDQITREMRAPLEDEIKGLRATMEGLRKTYNSLHTQAETVRKAMQSAGVVNSSSSGGFSVPEGQKPHQALETFTKDSGFEPVPNPTGYRGKDSKGNPIYGGHNDGSLHYEGLALDVRVKGKTDEEIEQFIRAAKAAGITVSDERTRPKGQKVWGGPHLHLSLPGHRKSARDSKSSLGGLTPEQQRLKDLYGIK